MNFKKKKLRFFYIDIVKIYAVVKRHSIDNLTASLRLLKDILFQKQIFEYLFSFPYNLN